MAAGFTLIKAKIQDASLGEATCIVESPYKKNHIAITFLDYWKMFQRDYSIDILKFACAVLVVFLHTSWRYQD